MQHIPTHGLRQAACLRPLLRFNDWFLGHKWLPGVSESGREPPIGELQP